MLREKRISKPPTGHNIFYPESKKHPQKAPKKFRKTARCDYKLIPNFSDTFCSKVITKLSDESHRADFSMLTMFKTCRSVEVSKNGATKKIKIYLEHKEDEKMSLWKETVERLGASKQIEAGVVKSILEDFNNKCLSLQENINQPQIKSQIDANSKTKIQEVMETMPCLQIKYRTRHSHLSATEAIINEKFIQDLGHSINSFISQILQDGFPQLFNTGSDIEGTIVESLVDNYTKLSQGGFLVSGLTPTLMLKSGYKRDVGIQIHFLPAYETEENGLDLLISTINKESPYSDSLLLTKRCPDEDVLCQKICDEQLLVRFLADYYQATITQRFTNLDKVCGIKQLHLRILEDD